MEIEMMFTIELCLQLQFSIIIFSKFPNFYVLWFSIYLPIFDLLWVRLFNFL